MQAELNRSLHETERERLAVNQEVVRLLQEKTIPLNKGRYLHLQKISRAVCKDNHLTYASSAQLTLNLQLLTNHTPQHPRSSSTSGSRLMLAADLLLQRLNAIKPLKHLSQLLSKDEQTSRCWQVLHTCGVQMQGPSSIQKAPPMKTPKSQGRRKRENLLELAERAEKYLRVKKRDLKERYCHDTHIDNRRQKGKQVGMQRLLTKVKCLKKEGSVNVTNKMLERQFLRDIRESMLQQKMNRMKREINHQKIVQMR